MQISDEMVNRADSVLSRVRGGIPDETIRLALAAAFAVAPKEAALSTDADPVAWQPRYKQEVIDHLRTVSDSVWEYAMTVYPTKEQAKEYGLGDHEVRALYADPVKTAPAVAVKELRWKGPDSSGEYHSLDGLWGYIIRAGNGNGFWLTEIGDYFPSPEAAQDAAKAHYETRIRSALSAQVQDVAGIRAQAIEDVLSALVAHELYQYRPKAFVGFIDYARSTLINDEDGKLWRPAAFPAPKHGEEG